METSALARVGSFLRYARPARWTAVLCGLATAVLYALLILLLALFADLLVTRGRIPNFAQLPRTSSRAWNASGRHCLKRIGSGRFAISGLASLKRRQRRATGRYASVASLSRVGRNGESEFPPIPGQSTSDQLLEWAKKNHIAGDPYYAAATEHELRWRAYVWHVLDRRVGADAADKWQPALESNSTFVLPGIGEDNARPYGILGLVVRQRNTFWGHATATFASVAGWTWRGNDPNRQLSHRITRRGIGPGPAAWH